MIRNTALLTLLVFIFTLFTPILMQPKEAYAVDVCDICEWVTDPEVSGAITMVFDLLKVSTMCILGCNAIRNWSYNKCTAEGTTDCDGTQWKCEGNTTLPGCGETMCICKREKHDDGTSTCTNDRCKEYGTTYRNCVPHTCSTDIISSSYSYSYSGSYW